MGTVAKRVAGAAVTGAALVAALGIAAGPVSALSWTITPSTGTWSATTVSPALGGITCTSGAASGTVGGSFNPVLNVNAHTWTGCTMSPMTFTFAAQGLPWHIQPTGATSGGVTPMSVTGVKIKLSGICTVTVAGTSATTTGTLTGTYSNSTHKLTLTGGNLHTWNIAGICLGLLTSGGAIPYTADYTFTPPLAVNAV